MTRRRLLLWSAPVTLVIVAAVAVLVWLSIAHRATAAHVGAGVTAARDGRWDDAERELLTAREGVGNACPAAVDLEIVRETQGDNAFGAGDGNAALQRYVSAREVVTSAPSCFAGAAERLDAKIDALRSAPPPPPPPAQAPPPPPPPPPPAAANEPAPADEPDVRRLNPGTGDPLDRLRQLLDDGAATRGGP